MAETLLRSEDAGAGRMRAGRLARGVSRLFGALGFSSVHEFVLPTGRRVDVAGLGGGGEFVFVEIKTSLADFRSDFKWESYCEFCDRLFFAVPDDFPREVLPEQVGLIIADAYGGIVLREAPFRPLAGARRKAMLLRFAHHAALRLQRLTDPELG
jgi:hypothetical protein